MKAWQSTPLSRDFHRSPGRPARSEGLRRVSLAESDVISIHCPLTPETLHLIDEDSVAKMKRGVMVINTSRGRVLDTRAVIGALKSQHIGYLGLDVYEEEEGVFFHDSSPEGHMRGVSQIDPLLGGDRNRADMILAEVKEGAPRFNDATLDPRVLGAGLARFGCCTPENAEALSRSLLKRGSGTTQHGHSIRIIAFGSGASGPRESHRYQVVSLGHVISFLEDYLRKDWEVLRQVQILEPGPGMLQVLMKARQGGS